MLRPEPLDFVIIALAAMLIFGANRLPETARAIGKAIREFRTGIASPSDDDQEETKPATVPPAPTTTVNCKNCAQPIAVSSKFCHHCGSAQ